MIYITNNTPIMIYETNNPPIIIYVTNLKIYIKNSASIKIAHQMNNELLYQRVKTSL